MTPEEGAKMIISGGMVSSNDMVEIESSEFGRNTKKLMKKTALKAKIK